MYENLSDQGYLLDHKQLIFHSLPAVANAGSNKLLLLFSGGVDSTTILYDANKRGFDVTCFSIVFPGRPESEIATAQSIADYLKTPITQVFLDTPNRPVSETDRSMINGIFPFRNVIFWAVAFNYAARAGFDAVVGGHTFEDGLHYPDATTSYFERMRELFGSSGVMEGNREIHIVLPLSERKNTLFNQHGNCAEFLELIDKTWSCWHDMDSPCGICGACTERNEFVKDLQGGHYG